MTSTPIDLSELFPSVPEEIQRILENRKLMEIPTEYTESSVFKALKGDNILFLKTQSTQTYQSFAAEIEILEWLQGSLPVPEVVAFTRDTENEYMILSEVAGVDCLKEMESYDPRRLVELLAEGLRTIHSLDISGCRFDQRISSKLKSAADNVLNGLVIEEHFGEERRGMTGEQILEILRKDPPAESNLVFNHGDYCLPNILLDNDQVSGFIDLSRAGVSDRYNDLAIASRSIGYNLGPEFEPLFFEIYGLDHLDKEKITYYRMMDELF